MRGGEGSGATRAATARAAAAIAGAGAIAHKAAVAAVAVVGAAKGDIAAGWWQGGSTPARVGGHASGGGQSGSGEVDDGEGISGGAASGEGADGEQTAAASPSFHWVKPWQRWARGAARCSVVCGGSVCGGSSAAVPVAIGKEPESRAAHTHGARTVAAHT